MFPSCMAKTSGPMVSRKSSRPILTNLWRRWLKKVPPVRVARSSTFLKSTFQTSIQRSGTRTCCKDLSLRLFIGRDKLKRSSRTKTLKQARRVHLHSTNWSTGRTELKIWSPWLHVFKRSSLRKSSKFWQGLIAPISVASRNWRRKSRWDTMKPTIICNSYELWKPRVKLSRTLNQKTSQKYCLRFWTTCASFGNYRATTTHPIVWRVCWQKSVTR